MHAPNIENIIITRHQGTVDWLEQQGIQGRVIEHADADDVRGAVVYGAVLVGYRVDEV